MLMVGIPCYKSKDTLPKALDSLVAQTKEMFLVVLSVDGDGEDYSDIVKTYTDRGLKIVTLTSDVNGGAGMARERILEWNRKQEAPCDYVMFLDSDDMFFPRAVEVTYREAKLGDFDTLAGSFILEQNGEPGYLMEATSIPCQWFHGRIYKTSYIDSIDLHFLPDIRYNEDSYFNLIGWNAAPKKGTIKEIVYLWRDNKNSVTRAEKDHDFFAKSYDQYIKTQVRGLVKLSSLVDFKLDKLISDTLINLYYQIQRARFYKLENTAEWEAEMLELGKQPFIQEFLNEGANWIYLADNVKAGAKFEDNVLFYKQPMNSFINHYLLGKEDNVVTVEVKE